MLTDVVFALFCLFCCAVLSAAECPSDIIFALDSSQSIKEANFAHQLDFVYTMVERFRVGTDYIRFGLVTYSEETRVEFHLNKYNTQHQVLAAIGDVEYAPRGERDIARLLRRVRTQMYSRAAGDRKYDLNILILLTAGFSVAGREKTIQGAKLTKNRNIHIITVGIGLLDDRSQEVDELASEPADINRYLTTDFMELNIIIPKLISHVCRGITNHFVIHYFY